MHLHVDEQDALPLMRISLRHGPENCTALRPVQQLLSAEHLVREEAAARTTGSGSARH